MSLGSLGDGAIPPGIAHPSGATIVVTRDLDDLSRQAAELFITLAQRAAQEEGTRFSVALSGGATPRSLYALLATPQYADQVPWERVHVFWGDERHVPPDDDESDYRMAYEALLSKVPIPAENVHRVRAELPDAAEAAREYADDLRGFFTLQPDEWPRFDLVLLGMGPDGHTASLFPGTDAVHETARLVAAPSVNKYNTYRITLTPPVLDEIRRGDRFPGQRRGEGGDLARRARRRAPARPVAAQLIAPANGTLLWLVERGRRGTDTT